MRILSLIESDGHVCYRYRIRAFEPALKAAGHDVDVMPAPHSLRGWMAIWKQAAAHDVVILQRKLLPSWYLWALRRAARRLVYDIDDAIFYRDSNSRKNPRSRRRWSRFRATVRQADVVLTGNRFLFERATKCAQRGAVVAMPTCVESENYAAALHRSSSSVRLVWIGSRSTLPSLYEAEASLSAAAARVPNCELRIVCNVFPTMANVRVVPRTWSEQNETAEIADADIGVSWLPEHPWSLGKCGLKVLQYMAAGLPVIANPYGVHLDLIDHGRTGFLADSPAAWAAAVERLASSPQLRREMGERARRIVDQRYGVTGRAAEFVAAVTGQTGKITAIDLQAA
jgi:hypothetical protein